MLMNEAIRLGSRQEQSHDSKPSTGARQRAIEDATGCWILLKTRTHPCRPAVRRLPWALARHGHGRGSAALPIAPGRSRHLAGVAQCCDHRAEVLLRGHGRRPERMAKMTPDTGAAQTAGHTRAATRSRGLIESAGNLKHQTALSVAYGAGLRASEVIALKVGDIDSQRMTLRVEQGKGRKDRYAMLPPLLLERLRTWWRVARAQGKMLDGGWLFPGLNPIDPLTPRQLNRAVHAAAVAARIDKRVSMHTLRHCCHASARAEGRHPRDPGPARTRQARDHRALYPGGHRDPARGHQSSGGRATFVGGVRATPRPGGRGHLPRPWAGLAASAARSLEPRSAQGDVCH